TQSAKGFLVQLGPDAGTGAKRQQAYCLAAVTERDHEQSRASILAALRVAHHGASAVIDLCFFSRDRDDYSSRCERLVSPQLANKAFDCLIASAESGLGDQVLPDCRGITTAAQAELDELAKRLTGRRSRFGIF